MPLRKSRKRRSRSRCRYGRKKSMRRGCKSRSGPKRRRSVRRRSRRRSVRRKSRRRSVRRRYKYNMDKKKLTIEKYDRMWPIKCYWTYHPTGTGQRGSNHNRLNKILEKFRNSGLNAREYFCGDPKGSMHIGQFYVHDNIAEAADPKSDKNAIWFEDANGELLAICVWHHKNLSETQQEYITILADHNNPEALKIQRLYNEYKEKRKEITKMSENDIRELSRQYGIKQKVNFTEMEEILINMTSQEYDHHINNMSPELKQEIAKIEQMQNDFNLYIDLLCTRPAGRRNGFAAELIYLLAYFHQYESGSCGKAKFAVSLGALDADEKGPVFQLYERLGAKSYRNTEYQIWDARDICEKWHNCEEKSLFHCRTTSDVDIIVNELKKRGYFEYNPDVELQPTDELLDRLARLEESGKYAPPKPPPGFEIDVGDIQPIPYPDEYMRIKREAKAEAAQIKPRISAQISVPIPPSLKHVMTVPTFRPQLSRQQAAPQHHGTYVDNPINRSLGRVGLPHGTHSPRQRAQPPARPSPSISAGQAPNQVMKGGDGKLWISQQRGHSPYRWYRQSSGIVARPVQHAALKQLNCKKFRKTVDPTCESHSECKWTTGVGCRNR